MDTASIDVGLFNSWEAIGTNISSLLFPLAGAIPQLKSFFFNDEIRNILGVFSAIFSMIIVLYCRSLGIYLAGAPNGYFAFELALLFFILYIAIIYLYRDPKLSKLSNLKKFIVLLFSSTFYIIFFILLTYSYNNIGLLHFSKVTVFGNVYLYNEKERSFKLADIPIEISFGPSRQGTDHTLDQADNTSIVNSLLLKYLLGGNKGDYLKIVTVTDSEGHYEIVVSLSALERITSMKANDRSGRYREDIKVRKTIPFYERLEQNFFLRQTKCTEAVK